MSDQEQPVRPSSSEPEPAPPSEAEQRSRLLTVGLLLAAAVLVAAWIWRSDRPGSQVGGGKASEKRSAQVGALAPDFQLKGLNGETVRLSDLKGKVVIVDFWATWCQPCVIMIPWFIQFRDRYASQGLEIVGIAMDDEGAEVVKPYAEKMKMNYRVVLGDEEVTKAWGGVFGLPTTFIIDRQGRVHARHIGLVGRDVFEREIRSLL